MRIGYFTNQYPAVSHTFIRREITALESLGVSVVRYALWTSDENIVHNEDREEALKTRYVFKASMLQILGCVCCGLSRPISTLRMLRTTLKVGWRSDRGLLRHFAYAIEALVLANWCERDKVEHLHAHFGTNSTTVAMLASQVSGVSYSFTAHGSEEFEKAPLLSLDEKLRNAAFAVCVSSYGRSQLMRWTPSELWSKIHVVHCGLDDQYLRISPQPPTSKTQFVCVGRLGEHKAQLLLVEAIRLLREAGHYCTLVLVGDGPMRPAVESAINEAGLNDRITITGWVAGDRVQREIIAARALVLPSFSENMPVVIMEAMALGRPVISTYIAGIPELVESGKTGWLVPSGDTHALAEAMRDALAAAPEQISKMGKLGNQRVAERHNAIIEARKLRALFIRSDHEPAH